MNSRLWSTREFISNGGAKTVDSNACMWNLKKICVDDLIYKAEIETDRENRCMDTKVEGGM